MRWHILWTYSIPNLNFDATRSLRSLNKLSERRISRERQKYIDWVNTVLNAYQGAAIHEFCVRFDLDAKDRCYIDKWVKFAIVNKVECLTMHFAKRSFGFRGKNQYVFPPLCTFSHSTSIRKLDLRYVDIGEDVIQHFLHSCPRLEYLAIKDSFSDHLVNLNIAGQSLCLKHLKINHCPSLKSIYLSSPNLSSFEYSGRMIDISYANVPNLVDVSFGDEYLDYIIYDFRQFSNHVTRLETLTLTVLDIKRNMSLVEYPELTCLRNLKLVVSVPDDQSILVFAPLIKKAPSLHKLELELDWLDVRKRSKVQKIPKSPHQCLKEVEISGFVGKTIDMEFAIYVLENAIALDKVTLDCRTPKKKAFGISVGSKDRRFAMKQAMFLESKFSLGNKLATRIL